MPSPRRPIAGLAEIRGLIGQLTQDDPREAQFDARLQLVLTAIVRRVDELDREYARRLDDLEARS